MKTECGKTHWGRWHWEDTGPGRWHAIADVGVGFWLTPRGIESGPVIQTACGRVRERPTEVEHEAPREECCPECLALDDLKRRVNEEVDENGTSVDAPPELVTA